MDNQRVEAGPAFDLEDARHSVLLRGIGAEAIDGFGWEGDNTAGAQPLRRGGDGLGVNVTSPCAITESRRR